MDVVRDTQGGVGVSRWVWQTRGSRVSTIGVGDVGAIGIGGGGVGTIGVEGVGGD